MIKCAECGKEISDSAEICPNCGCKTRHGETVSQAKGLAVSYVIVAALMIVGAFLLYKGLTDGGLFKILIGIGFILGGIIDMVKIKNQADELNYYNTTQSVQKTENEQVISAAYIPEDKRQRDTCEMCKAEGMVAECKIPNQFGSHKLCPKCISRYNASIQ